MRATGINAQARPAEAKRGKMSGDNLEDYRKSFEQNRAGTASVAVIAALGLSACATKTVNDKLKTYADQPASALIAKLGYPTRQDAIAGK
jgi:hypothetical protein